MLMRIRFPSLFGVAPMSDCMMAFSMAGMAVLSYGCTTSMVDSGAEIPARDLRGVGAP